MRRRSLPALLVAALGAAGLARPAAARAAPPAIYTWLGECAGVQYLIDPAGRLVPHLVGEALPAGSVLQFMPHGRHALSASQIGDRIRATRMPPHLVREMNAAIQRILFDEAVPVELSAKGRQ